MSRVARCWSSWTVSALVVAALLAACGGSGWQATFTPTGVRQGAVLDGAVEGRPEGGRRAAARPRPELGRAARAVAGAPGRRGLRRDLSALRAAAAGSGRARQHRRRRRARARHARPPEGAARPRRPLARRTPRRRGCGVPEAAARDRVLPGADQRADGAGDELQADPADDEPLPLRRRQATRASAIRVRSSSTSASSTSASRPRGSTAASSIQRRASPPTTCRCTR